MDKKIVLMVIAVVAIVLAVLYVLQISGESTKYVCADGRVVFNSSECVTTTVETTATTELATTIETKVKTTTRITTLGPSTTFACISNEECGVQTNSSPYCEDNYVKTSLLKPVCINPKTFEAKCGFTPTGVTHVLQVCNSLKEFCFQGRCVPRTCVNGKHDTNEGKIDCGGVCPLMCDEFSVMCNNNSDCGEVSCSAKYYCVETNVAYDCSYKQCVNNGTNKSACVDASITKIKEVCKRAKHCEEGRGLCMEGGTCSDYTRNQDETKVDCGGESCRPCAPLPEAYNSLTLSGLNNFNAKYVDNYATTYEFTLTKVVFTGDYPSGAKLRLDKESVVIASGEIDRYSNVVLHKFNVGLLNVSTSSATIWISEPE